MTTYTQKNNNCQPTRNHPELVEFLMDVAVFTQKWKTPQIARVVGVKRQALQQQIEKRKKRIYGVK